MNKETNQASENRGESNPDFGDRNVPLVLFVGEGLGQKLLGFSMTCTKCTLEFPGTSLFVISHISAFP